jgi:hypothetical protein
MSLKSFHIVFIAASLGLCALTAWWGFGQPGTLPMAMASFCAAALVGGTAYLGWFLKKHPSL